MDAWRRYSYSMYHSGVKLAMRSQPRSKYPRYVYLQGRTEPCSEFVIEGYGCLRVSCSSRRLLAESMTESKDRQERCLAADSLRQQDARPRRCQSTEPPYAEPLVRWCGRTHGELIPMLLPNCFFADRKRLLGTLCKHIQIESVMEKPAHGVNVRRFFQLDE